MTAKIEADSASVTASFAHHAARVEQSPLSYAGAQDSRRRSDTMDQPPEECAVAQQDVVQGEHGQDKEGRSEGGDEELHQPGS